MKKIRSILLIVLLFTFFIPAVAQPEGKKDRHERIEAMKVAFLTTKLELTPAEAKIFWPVYDQYQKEMRELHSQRRMQWQKRNNALEGMSDKEITTLIDNNIKYEQQELDIRKKYHQQFKEVLPVRKVALLYNAERDFKLMLIKKLREKHRSDD